MRVIDILNSAGLFQSRGERTVWLSTDSQMLGTVYPIVDEALRKRTGYRLVIAVPYAQLADVRRRLPHESVVPQPRWSGGSMLYSKRSARLIVADPGGRPSKAAGMPALLAEGEFNVNSILARLPVAVPAAQRRQPRKLLLQGVMFIAGRPLQGVEEVSRRLGTPETILCLGNGPSGEDPRLGDYSHDVLFRVNWNWLARGFLATPDLVFTADRDLPASRPRPIIAFPNERLGLPIVIEHTLKLSPPRQGYFFADHLLSNPDMEEDQIVPSNGAIMIAVAAALKPRRIIIAGIDLYEHEAGRYPGDALAVDGYSRDHSRSCDMDFIRTALGQHHGDLVILSDHLRNALNL